MPSTSLGNSCSKYQHHLIKMNKESTVRASVTDNEQLHHWCPTPSQIFEKKSPTGHHETIWTDNRKRQLNLIQHFICSKCQIYALIV